MGYLLGAYLALHVGLGLTGMMFLAFTTGITDYGGAYGFLPSVDLTVYDLGDQFAGTDPGSGASDLRTTQTQEPTGHVGLFKLFIDTMQFIARLPGIVLGLFTFNYPILQAGGEGFFPWFGMMFRVVGSIASVGFTIWLLRLIMSAGLLSNAWVWVIAGVSIGGLTIANFFGIGG